MHLSQMHMTPLEGRRLAKLLLYRQTVYRGAGVLMSRQTFHILLSLGDGPMHGYAIIQDVAERTQGDVRLTASTLYDALARLVDQAFIRETGRPASVKDHDARRRYYELTPDGRRAAKDEVRRLERALAVARERL
jgi:DNA-binding PadR family transcriptional regulator